MAQGSRSLDYATRALIAKTVVEEMRAAQLVQRELAPRQLHGPCSTACEEFVIGIVLAGKALPADLELAPHDFWLVVNQRFWESIMRAGDPTNADAIVADCVERGRFSGPPEDFVSRLLELRSQAVAELGLYDAIAAAELLRTYARDRRLVGLLARLADGICAGSESHESAMVALRDHFQKNKRKAAQ